MHGHFIHQPPQLLHSSLLLLSSLLSWPFHAWALDMVGTFKPPSSRNHVFILVATYYFWNWVEAISLGEVGAKQIADFITTHIIYRYGLPYKSILDNTLHIKNQIMIRLAEKYKFKHRFLSSYNPPWNGQVESFNKVLCKILKKMVSSRLFNFRSETGLNRGPARTGLILIGLIFGPCFWCFWVFVPVLGWTQKNGLYFFLFWIGRQWHGRAIWHGPTVPHFCQAQRFLFICFTFSLILPGLSLDSLSLSTIDSRLSLPLPLTASPVAPQRLRKLKEHDLPVPRKL